jgi:glycosyltransferase involved in cell wall biosynthesis
MDISVVIPCFNAEKFIAASLCSVAEQVRKPFEVIVVDDGSSDASIAAARATGVPFELLHTDRFGGAGARNRGVEASTGGWIAFLDADDVWYPDHLARAAEVIERLGVAGYINHYDHVSVDGNEFRVRPCPIDSVVEGVGLDAYIDLFARYGHFVGMSACIVARERFRAIGGFCREQTRRHDIEFWLRFVDGQRWVFDPISTSAYRKNRSGGLSAAAAESALDGFRAFLVNRDKAVDRASFDAVLQERARSALSNSFSSDSDELRARAYRIAYDYLAPRNKLIFSLVRRYPSLFRAFRAVNLA